MKQVDVIPWTQVTLDLAKADLVFGVTPTLGVVK
jgi:hypothetical protein